MVALLIGFLLMAFAGGMLMGAATDNDLPSYARRALGFTLALQAAAEVLILVGLLATI